MNRSRSPYTVTYKDFTMEPSEISYSDITEPKPLPTTFDPADYPPYRDSIKSHLISTVDIPWNDFYDRLSRFREAVDAQLTQDLYEAASHPALFTHKPDVKPEAVFQKVEKVAPSSD